MSILGLGAIGHFAQVMPEAMGIINHVVDCKLLPDKYDLNTQFKNLMPSFSAMIESWKNGTASELEMGQCAAFNNIALQPNPNDHFQNVGYKLWRAVLMGAVHQLSYQDWLVAYWLGIIDKDRFNAMTRGYKIRQSHDDVMLELARGKFPIDEIFQLVNRGTWDDTDLIKEIRRSHAINESDAKDVASLRKLIPPPTELVRFLVRHVWEPDIRADLGLDDEYDRVAKAIPWFNAVGMYDNMTIYGRDDVDPVDWIKAEWATHWKAMSPEQGFVARQRLRPERMAKWQGIDPEVTPFTQKELNQLLRMDDYVPKMRHWLTAISYHVINIRQLKQLYFEDVLPRDEVKAITQDQGYIASDAEALTTLLDKQKKEYKDNQDEKLNRKRYAKFRQAITDGYREGSITETAARNGLVSTGLKDDVIDPLIASIDLEVNRKLMGQFLVMVKNEFMLGGMNSIDAVSQLVNGGFTSVRANQYVILWQRQLGRPRRTAQAQKLIDWYSQGYLNALDLSQRLSNLGYANGDILIYNAEANRKLAENVARIEAAQARTVRQQVEATNKMFREAQAAIRSQQAQMRTYSGLVQMRKWYIAGEIDEAEVRARMTFLAIPLEDQDRYFLDWNLLRR